MACQPRTNREPVIRAAAARMARATHGSRAHTGDGRRTPPAGRRSRSRPRRLRSRPPVAAARSWRPERPDTLPVFAQRRPSGSGRNTSARSSRRCRSRSRPRDGIAPLPRLDLPDKPGCELPDRLSPSSTHGLIMNLVSQSSFKPSRSTPNAPPTSVPLCSRSDRTRNEASRTFAPSACSRSRFRSRR